MPVELPVEFIQVISLVDLYTVLCLGRGSLVELLPWRLLTVRLLTCILQFLQLYLHFALTYAFYDL